MSKKCSQCKEVKPDKGFFMRKGVRNAYCKDCYKKYDRKRYYKNREKRNAITLFKFHHDPRTLKRMMAQTKVMNARYPEKAKCRSTLGNAIAAGNIRKRNSCEICHNSPTECHHEDYKKPLDFIELCHYCHMFLHRKFHLR